MIDESHNFRNGGKISGDEDNEKEKIVDFIFVLLGSFALAVASAYFIVPHDVLTGGVAGLSIIITQVTGEDPKTVTRPLTETTL